MVVVFVVGDPGGVGVGNDISPSNPGREEAIRITAEGAATMGGTVRARSEENIVGLRSRFCSVLKAAIGHWPGDKNDQMCVRVTEILFFC